MLLSIKIKQTQIEKIQTKIKIVFIEIHIIYFNVYSKIIKHY